MRNLPLGLASTLLVAGCGAPPDEPAPVAIGSLSQAVGEPMNGFPSPEERLGIMAINRARSDPETVKGPQSTSYPARPPVLWSYDLSRSSRFHATNLQLSNVSLMHTSPCKLNTNIATTNCNGAPACACSGAIGAACQSCANAPAINSCGTDTFTRIAYFSTIATGEVAAAGYSDTWSVVDGWMDEAAGADGHRMNLTDQGITSNTMGFGHSEGAGCWSSFDVSDSGDQQGLAIPKIPTAAVKPARPSSGSSAIYATWADPSLGAPKALYAVVDGQCFTMKKELGTETLNSTWYATVNAAAGCHTYYALGHDANGARVTFPTTGAIYMSVGGVACASDYTGSQPAASCEGAVATPDLAMHGGTSYDLAIHGGARDLAGGRGFDDGVAGDGDGSADTGYYRRGSGCAVGGHDRAGGLAGVVFGALAMVATATRRRRARRD